MMYSIFYSDEAMAKDKKSMIMDVHTNKILINPANIQ